MKKMSIFQSIANLIISYLGEYVSDDEFTERWIRIGLLLQQSKKEYDKRYKPCGVDIYKLWEQTDE